jgi:hypothetical protein
LLRTLKRQHGLEEFVELLPPMGYRLALEEMIRADALLVLQAANCNEQIPAKIYEYLRTGRPILALTDPQGDTAGILRESGLDSIARLDSVDEIAALLARFVSARDEGLHAIPNRDYVGRASRAMRTQALAALLDQSAVGS